MSVEYLTDAWAHGPDDPGDLLLLLAITDRVDHHGVCRTPMRDLARWARMDEGHVPAALDRLSDAGWLVAQDGHVRVFKSEDGQ